jgi:hypothetical protein
MGSGQQSGQDAGEAHPAAAASAGLLHHRRGWIWTLVASLAGLIVAFAVAATVITGGTASFLLDLVGLLMLAVFVVALVMVFVITAQLRQHAPEVRGPALAAHRAASRPVLAHPHNRHHHPLGFTVGLVMLAGWLLGAVVIFPRLVDSIAYLAGAGSSATFVPGSYVQTCSPRVGCSIATNGVMTVNGHELSTTWPAQVPLGVPFTVREPVWRWAAGSGLISGNAGAIGSLLVGLLFEGGTVLVLFVMLKPRVKRLRHPSRKPAAVAPALVRQQPKRRRSRR